MRARAIWRTAGLKAARRRPLPSPRAIQRVRHPEEPPTKFTPSRYALGRVASKADGCTMTMLSARGVKVETINELIATGLVTATIERVGRGTVEITRVKITEAGRRALV